MYQFIFGCCYTVKEYPPFPSRNYIFLFCVFTFGSSLALPAPAHFDSFLDILFSKSIKFLLLPPESLCLYLLEFFLNIYIYYSVAVWSPGSALSMCPPPSSCWLSGSSSQLYFLAILLPCKHYPDKAAGKLWVGFLSLLVVLLGCLAGLWSMEANSWGQ